MDLTATRLLTTIPAYGQGFGPVVGDLLAGAMFPLSTYSLLVGGVFAVPLPPDPIPLLGARRDPAGRRAAHR
ncbi:hypothetical protein CS0771_32620 [Catellatospora sp. IY07-71]|uniref:hypothetical protein n=1 Tax=Catellatospora sp. IY07-71 TaxID=2728827 RepID=UPI001BB391FC|nr:hypothetical protein [Catellatospora sp. IY07-71]BCJ73718.1 hypothetical protein CS0771_32620 [Catellatospora sp. IY07-71]